MNSLLSIQAAARALCDAAAASRHRRLAVIAGERQWGYLQVAEFVAVLPGDWCWIGDEACVPATPIAVEKAHTLLGGEWHGIIYDARAGFDPDAFGAASGTLRGGGLLLLLTPPLNEWGDYADPQRRRLSVYPYREEQVGGRFLHRLASMLRVADEAYLIEQGRPLPAPPPLNAREETAREETASEGLAECASADQLAAVEALCKVAQGHRRRPLVLVSDRGRGKSTALGLAAARLLQQGLRRIVVTAPRLAAVEQLFQHAADRLPGAEYSRGLLRLPSGAQLRFEPPDRIVQEDLSCDLLLVDEAAAIPVSLLEPLLRRHARIAFATTVHGYEGTGRGFDLRFRKVLDRQTPEWRRLRMQQPIRWAGGDPLERLVFRTLLLDAEPAADEAVATIAADACQFELVNRETLLNDEPLLAQLFGLLVLAHYRTSPGDLRNLLDGPNLDIAVLRHQKIVLGCALVAREGGFDALLSQQIYAGERRLRGNLLPQSLATHAGLERAPQLTAARVMRIAIHPARQGEGLGRRLIAGLVKQLSGDGVDYLGASFGADVHLLDFWRGCDCLPVRVGLKREASSGAHAMMVMRPLSPAGEALYSQARRRLVEQLSTLLSEPLATLESPLVGRLLRYTQSEAPGREAWADTRSFALLQRDYGNCLSGLRQCLLFALSDAPELFSAEQQALAIAKVLQLRPWPELVEGLGFAGRKAAIEALRDLFRTLCRHYP